MTSPEASSRFRTPASGLDLGQAARQTRALAASLAVSMVVHAGIAAVHIARRSDARERPLAVRFVKRRPPPLEAFQLRARPRPQRYQLMERTRRVYARVRSPIPVRSVPARWVGAPWAHLSPAPAPLDSVTFERPELEPTLPEGEVRIVPFPDRDKIRRKLEMMDLKDLDTGRYHALVYQNPDDKGEVSGFLHIVNVYLASQDRARAGYARVKGAALPPRGSALSLPNLVRAMNEFTGIKVDILGTIGAESPELLKAPWALFAGQAPFEPTRMEAENLGRYLASGGFLFLDAEGLGMGPLRNLLHASLASLGLRYNRHWEFVTVGPKHPIFDSYFQLGGPPVTANPWLIDPDSGTHLNTRRPPLIGAEVAGRLAALLTAWGYSALWAYHDSQLPSSDANEDVKRAAYQRWSTAQGALRFGVNLLVYVLTQPGSITDRTMRRVFY